MDFPWLDPESHSPCEQRLCDGLRIGEDSFPQAVGAPVSQGAKLGLQRINGAGEPPEWARLAPQIRVGSISEGKLE